MPRTEAQEQLALFGIGRVPNLWTRDFRSVGELLADTDFQSRALLMDLEVGDAPGLLVGWPDLLDASAELWRALPSARTPVAAQAERQRMELLVARGNGYRAALRQARVYLEGVEPDARLAAITDTLTRTTRLVSKFSSSVDISKEPARSDLAAARTRLLHTLYLTVHAVHSSMRQLRATTVTYSNRQALVLPKLNDYRPSRAVALLDSWVQRLGSTEGSVGRALDGTYPRALQGEVVAAPDDALRLPRALATWEIAVNRILCTSPTNADLALISRTEGLVIAAGHRVIGASAVSRWQGVVERCEPVAAGWARSASWWQTLTPTGDLLSDALVAAAGELRAATRALTFDRTQPAAPETIANRPEYADAVEAFLTTFEHVRDTAEGLSDRSHSSKLHGPARALSRAAHDLAEDAGLDVDTVWVSPEATLTNLTIRAPEPVARAMRAAARTLASDAAALAQASIEVNALVGRSAVQAVASAAACEERHRRHRPTAHTLSTATPRR